MEDELDMDMLMALVAEEEEEKETNTNNNTVNDEENGENYQKMKLELEEMQKRMQWLEQQLQNKNKKPETNNFSEKQMQSLPQNKTGTMKDPKSFKNQHCDKQQSPSSRSPSSVAVKKKLIDVDLLGAENDSNNRSNNNQLTLNHRKPKSPNTQKSVVHSGDTDSSDDEDNRNPMEIKYNEFGKFIKQRIAHNPSYDTKNIKEKETWFKKKHSPKGQQRAIDTMLPKKKADTKIKIEENVETDIFSGIRIVNPVVSSMLLKERMQDRRMIRLSLLRSHLRGDDIEGDWVTIAVVIGKTEPKTSSKGKSYSIWRLNDLRNLSTNVSLFLFGDVHKHHWKTSVGSVIGILNASVMPNRDTINGNKTSEINLSVNHAQKLMLIGQSKDFGTCKGRRKDGTSCNAVVNLAECEFCEFHVQAAYRKLSSKRSDLQGTFSGVEPKGLRDKIMKKNQIMYGGQIYCSPSSNAAPQRTKKNSKKDQLLLESLKLQKRAHDYENEIKKPILNKSQLRHMSNEDIKVAEMMGTKSSFLGEALTSPSPGSRNLLRCLSNEQTKQIESKAPVKSISPAELLKMHRKTVQNCVNRPQERRSMNSSDSGLEDSRMSLCTSPRNPSILNGNIPKLGNGFAPGEDIFLEGNCLDRKVGLSISEKAKLNAIQKIRVTGPLPKENPNNVKRILKSNQDINLRIRSSSEEAEDSEPLTKKPRLKNHNMTSEDLMKIMNRKSKYADILNDEELEQQEKYFNELERKEKLETKMSSIMEVVCNAVSCKKCQYTALTPSELCKTEGHPLVSHKAKKRFFQCKDCKQRTVSLNKIPAKSCRTCGGANYERVSMWKERNGPKLESEKLFIRGNEINSLNSLSMDVSLAL